MIETLFSTFSDKKAKKSFLEKIGLRRRKKTNESNSREEDDHHHQRHHHDIMNPLADDDDNMSEHTTGSTSSSESIAARNSTESNQSGTIQMPNAFVNLRDHAPHTGLPVKVIDIFCKEKAGGRGNGRKKNL